MRQAASCAPRKRRGAPAIREARLSFVALEDVHLSDAEDIIFISCN
jgi:hypothetical protein